MSGPQFSFGRHRIVIGMHPTHMLFQFVLPFEPFGAIFTRKLFQVRMPEKKTVIAGTLKEDDDIEMTRIVTD